ncbi:AAA family ATPase [Luteolibacter sp. Populi]|uniref:AAA family ATPase n=1 Tax=Luteolibacter sp. Populi TaxID=3230487 RepID=UPI003467CA21
MAKNGLEISFSVVSEYRNVPSLGKLQAYLIDDRWDDWGSYRTQFHLVVFDQEGNQHRLGNVKIGQFGLKPSGVTEPGQRAPSVPKVFKKLDETFFSLGQEDEYYEQLGKLPAKLRDAITHAMRDVVADRELWHDIQEEQVTTTSLLRSVTTTTVERAYRRMLGGGDRLTSYSFRYDYPKRGKDADSTPLSLEFQVRPESFPPTNVHVIIGGNGVGKTYTLTQMVKALAAGGPHTGGDFGSFTSAENEWNSEAFANVVMVSFSAFDPFDTIDSSWEIKDGMKHSYIGLKEYDGSPKRANKPKTPEQLVAELDRTIGACLVGARRKRWIASLKTLESDPVFADFEISQKLSEAKEESKLQPSYPLLNELSSGHKIVLLTVAGLIEKVEERTLVLLDEPESHLHPPLLAAFVRTLSDILIDRNGVAIVATHSPVVLQEVPKNCVWKLRRIGLECVPERPVIETFGENIGVLTREVFTLEVTASGFHQILKEVVAQVDTYEEAVEKFRGRLGGEARAILRAMMSNKDSDTDGDS